MNAVPAISDVIPHRSPMALLDAIESWDGQNIVCRADVRSDSLFVERGRTRAIVTLEYMAQAVAASVGIKRGAGIESRKPGFLVGVRTIELHTDYLHLGDRLQIRACRSWGDETLATFAASTYRDEELIAESTFTVFRGEIGAGMSP